MGRTLPSPDAILPTRMTLTIPTNSDAEFSVLDFPFAKACETFMERFERIFRKINNLEEKSGFPYELRLPWRQLNDAIMALAPGLVQPFEPVKDGDEPIRRMVAFTQRDPEGNPIDLPSIADLKSLIQHWLEHWGRLSDVTSIVEGEGKGAWSELLSALKGIPETQWRHGIRASTLADSLGSESGLGYIVLPALLTAVLHGREMSIQSEKHTYVLKWRRVNGGGKNGLHLISQPLRYQDDYYAYRLDFSVQTQAGFVDEYDKTRNRVWIFAHVSIQRYMTEKVHYLDERRTTSVLVGWNGDQFLGGWDTDTTLIRLPVDLSQGIWEWETRVGDLLNGFSMRKLATPSEVFASPRPFGNYDGTDKPEHTEYYIVYATGRKYGDERARGHQVKTGTSLRERSQIIDGILALLDGWLHASPALVKDAQNPDTTFALRDYDYMVDKNRKDNSRQQASWQTMLRTALHSGNHTHLHLVVLYRSDEFLAWAKTKTEEALMGADQGTAPIATVTYLPLQPSLYLPFDTGGLDPRYPFLPREKKNRQLNEQWKNTIRESYGKKRDEWRVFLRGINWKQHARRLVLIDSTGERDSSIGRERKIKGAIRDACHREKVLSQFIVGDDLRLDRSSKRAGKLDPGSNGRLQHAVLDLLVRQQGLLYAPPSEIYEFAAGLEPWRAKDLDVVALCRVEREVPFRLNSVLAVKLCADGGAYAALPSAPNVWLPLDQAAHQVGKLFSEEKSKLTSKRRKLDSPLLLEPRAMLDFAYDVLTQDFRHPTLAVIEAEGWRNFPCWIQLRNGDLQKQPQQLRFDNSRVYERDALALRNLVGVVRLRMNSETPQYVTAADWADEEPMRDIAHLTGYVDPSVPNLLHYFSVAGLSETHRAQNEYAIAEQFKGDLKDKSRQDGEFKHAQLIELVPFFVHPDFDSDLGRRQLCRCVHFLRVSPAFSMGQILLPYPMHLGETLVEDQICIVSADD